MTKSLQITRLINWFGKEVNKSNKKLKEDSKYTVLFHKNIKEFEKRLNKIMNVERNKK